MGLTGAGLTGAGPTDAGLSRGLTAIQSSA